MKEVYVLEQVETIYGMAFLMSWAHDAVLDEFRVILDTNKQVVNLNRLSIVNGKRGRGYGRALLKQVCKEADREDVILTLSVEADDPSHHDWIHGMYERAGFRDHEELGGMVRWPEAHVRTEPRLDSTRSAERLEVVTLTESPPSNTPLQSTP